MIQTLTEFTEQHRDVIYTLLRRYFALNQQLLLQSDLRGELVPLQEQVKLDEDASKRLSEFVAQLHEGVMVSPWAYFTTRPAVGQFDYLRIHQDNLIPERVTPAEFLMFKEQLAHNPRPASSLEIDFGPFSREFPKLKETRSIGQGLLFLNRQLASGMFTQPQLGAQKLLHFLGVHAVEGQQMMFLSTPKDTATATTTLRTAIHKLESMDDATPWAEFAGDFAKLGFAPGWGNNAARAAETMNLLMDILEAPSPASLESLLARIPMISRILIVSPHGYFGQANVLGLPDTGGQVVYILDQVRALEKEMRERLLEQGVKG